MTSLASSFSKPYSSAPLSGPLLHIESFVNYVSNAVCRSAVAAITKGHWLGGLRCRTFCSYHSGDWKSGQGAGSMIASQTLFFNWQMVIF